VHEGVVGKIECRGCQGRKGRKMALTGKIAQFGPMQRLAMYLSRWRYPALKSMTNSIAA
jgi:hypothetical protein